MNLKSGLVNIKTNYTEECIQCGACIEACPYHELGAIGSGDPVDLNDCRLELLRDGVFSEAAYHLVRGCLMCGACNDACPLELNPCLINIIGRTELAKWNGPVGERYGKDTANLRPLLPDSSGNIFNTLYQLQVKPHEVTWLSGSVPDAPQPVDTVLFLSCMAMSRADRLLTTIDLLKAAGVNFQALAGIDYCCGLLNVLAGDVGRAQTHLNGIYEAMAAYQAETFIVDCTSCFGWLHHLMQIEPLPFEVKHLTQVLDERLPELPLKRSVVRTVTLHDTCHFGRRPQEAEAPRRLMAAIPGVNLVEMAHNREHTLCCGASASGYQPEIAKTIRSTRLAEARAVNPDALLTVCEGCLNYFKGHAESEAFTVDSLNNFIGGALGIAHENRLAKLYACKNEDEVLHVARGCLWEDKYSPAEMKECIKTVFRFA